MSNYFIPKPCHEKWDSMTPKEQGRHCDVCSKVVVDFTKKTDHEINHIMESANGRVCGHFSLSQLDPKAQKKVFIQPANLFTRNWKYFAMTVFGFLLLGKKTEAQKTRGIVKMSGEPKQAQHNENTSPTKIYGTIYSPGNQPLGGAEIVVISGNEIIGQLVSIANGTYTFTITPGKLKGKAIDLVVKHSFYENKVMSGVPINKAINRINITLEEEMFIMGDIAPVEEPVIDTAPAKIEPVIDTVKICTPDTSVNKTPKEKPEINEDQEQQDDAGKTKHDPVTDPNAFVRPEDIVATIYPNPAGNFATIYCNRNTSYQVELFDEKGTLYMSRSFQGDRTNLDVSGLAKGTYFVRVKDGDEHTNTMKLVKQ